MAKNITRRQFLKRTAAATAGTVLAPHMRWLPGTNVSYAAGGPNDAILVYLFLDGGNDGLNTVYPLDGSQRDLYEEFRPSLQLPTNSVGLGPWRDEGFNVSDILNIGVNDDGSQYALHPSMTALHDVYQQGQMAIAHGVHYPHPNHSHFRSTEIWETGDPLGTSGLGWFGKYLSYANFGPIEVPGVIMANSVSPLFSPTNTSLFAFRRLSALKFPSAHEAELTEATFRSLYDGTDTLDQAAFPELVKLAQTGIATVEKMQEYYKSGGGFDDEHAGKVEKLLLNGDGDYNSRNDLIYPSPLNDEDNPEIDGFRIARDMRHVAATIRADVGARFFHVRMGGFDSHSSQEDGFFHSFLLKGVSEAMAGLYNELKQSVSLPSGYSGYRTGSLADKVIIVTFSEFGRTMRQNAQSPSAAGTDHAACAPQWLIGDAVLGGQYGEHPQLDNPRDDNTDDLQMVHDFRDFYGTILERWLRVPASEIGPGPDKIFAATPEADEDGKSYTEYEPIPFLPENLPA